MECNYKTHTMDGVDKKLTLYMPFTSAKRWVRQFEVFENVLVTGLFAAISHPYDAVESDWPLVRVEVDEKNIVERLDIQYMCTSVVVKEKIHARPALYTVTDFRRPNGTVVHVSAHGLLHREDGPAVYNPATGEECWYRHGVKHRDTEDLPAETTAARCTFWYRGGLLHREGDQPAHQDPSRNYACWYKLGEKHRDGNLPAETIDGNSFWYVHGKLHRDDGPALVVGKTECWYRHGVKHRDTEDDLPAETTASGCMFWFRHGLLHRDRNKPAFVTPQASMRYVEGRLHGEDDEPAVELYSSKPPVVVTERKWYCKGLLHRGDDQPAIVTTTMKAWYKDGCLHREHNQPALVFDSGEVWYYVRGALHRTDGPAGRLVGTGCETAPLPLAWYFEGRLHRDGDLPAVTYGPGEEEWYAHGLLHRDTGPAKTFKGGWAWYRRGLKHRDGNEPALYSSSDGLEIEKYYVNNQLHRDEDLPASIRTTVKEVQEEWYRHGVLHRADGKPARVRRSHANKILSQEWFVDGKRRP